jgi:uncharacterized membrane protein (UPF0127 family)
MTGYIFKNCDTSRRVLILSFATSCVFLLACTSQDRNATNKPVRSEMVQPNTSKLTTTTPAKASQNSELAQILPITATAKISGRAIALEVTRTPSEQAKGLMYRPALPDDRGMLFNFNPPRPVAFWMKNVPVALDMIFIHNQRVVAIAAKAPPCVKEPCAIYPAEGVIADRVIELRSGLASEIGLKVGDLIVVENKPTDKPTDKPQR